MRTCAREFLNVFLGGALLKVLTRLARRYPREWRFGEYEEFVIRPNTTCEGLRELLLGALARADPAFPPSTARRAPSPSFRTRMTACCNDPS